MKINERTLMSYATAPLSPVDKTGWLWKRGEVNKNFQRRHFVLRGNLLFYFEKKGDKEPVGVIILEGCTIELAEEEQEKFAFKIVFHGEGKRTYILGTEDQDTLESWMKILACSSYDYMKLMVVELQQQLAELDEAERLGQTGNVLNGSRSQQQLQDQQPKAPPRQRVNPFDQPDEEGGARKKAGPKRTWASLHAEAGIRIVKDREAWCSKQEKARPLIDL